MKKQLLILLLFLLGNTTIAQTNLNVNSSIEITEDGNYNLNMNNNAYVKIKSAKVNIQNININSGAVGLHIDYDADVTFQSSLNINGNFIFRNDSPKTKVNGNIDIQNGNNTVIINASMSTHVLQLIDKTSTLTIKGCGTEFTAKQTTSLDAGEGKFTLLEGASYIANGMDVNRPNIITGIGFIRVNGNFNLNHNFTTSNTITLCHKGHLNNPEKTGSAKLFCDYLCNPMPVKLEYFKTERIDKDNIKVKFRFSDLDQMSKLRVLVSKNIKDKKAYLVIDKSKLQVNKNYSFVVNISK